MPNYTVNPHWDTSQKIASREDSVLIPYREHFARSIPPKTQYWTLCGAHYTGEHGHEVAAGGEFTQHLDKGLFEPRQFHGVDRDPHTIAMNKRFYPGVNWHCGDFLATIKKAQISRAFNPAIINYDSVHEPKRGGLYLRKLMHFIDLHVAGELMLAANFVLSNPRSGHVFSSDDVIEMVERDAYQIPDHWTVLPKSYVYGGGAAANSRSLMGTLIFLKSAHQRVVVSPKRRLDMAA